MSKSRKIFIYTFFIIISLCMLAVVIYIAKLYKEPRVPVLCYHNVAKTEERNKFPEEKIWTMELEKFEEQMKYLHDNGYKSLTMDEFYEWKKGNIELPLKSVLITFDDGFYSNYYYAFPILKKYGLKATVFLIGQDISPTEPKWDGNIVKSMSMRVINKCKEEYPNIEFQSHSLKLHKKGILKYKDNEEIVKDFKEFKEMIKDVEYFAYPFGDYNDKIIDILKKSKFKLAFIYGPNKEDYRKATRNDNDYLIPRLNINNDMPLYKFKYRLLMPY